MRMRKIIALGLFGLVFGATYLGAQKPIVRVADSEIRWSTADNWTASVSLDRIPPEPVFLFLKLKNVGGQDTLSRLEILLNNKTVAQGQVSVSESFWRYKRFLVPANRLRTGLNILGVKSGEKGGGKAAPVSLEISEALLADHRFAPRLDAVFPGRYTRTKETLKSHVEQMR
jgi:hypothetical protein